jgi:hypothetical protein
MNTDKKMRTVVIYHRADFDGIFCREIARKHFGDKAEYIGWDYGDPEPVIPVEATVYILDLSVPGLMHHPGLIWIDHHKSAIDKYPKDIPGYRIDGVAACRLTWQWFFNAVAPKEDFIERRVEEPYAVRLAGEYDIWDKRDPDAELFQHGLRSQEITAEMWDVLLNLQTGHLLADQLLIRGKFLQYARTEENKSVILAHGFTVDFEGLRFLACNSARFNSLLFTAGLKPEHDGCLGFCWDGKGWKVSLYHAPGKENHDLSVITSKYGGGGHRGACGFRSDYLPFVLPGEVKPWKAAKAAVDGK